MGFRCVRSQRRTVMSSSLGLPVPDFLHLQARGPQHPQRRPLPPGKRRPRSPETHSDWSPAFAWALLGPKRSGKEARSRRRKATNDALAPSLSETLRWVPISYDTWWQDEDVVVSQKAAAVLLELFSESRISEQIKNDLMKGQEESPLPPVPPSH